MMRGSGGPVLAVLFNIIALSAVYIGNIVWKCGDRGYNNTYNELMSNSDAPSFFGIPNSNDNGIKISRHAAASSGGSDNSLSPSYLKWDLSTVEPPDEWAWQNTKSISCNNNNTNSKPYDPEQKIIVHMHLQHNAGTEFFFMGKEYSPCATRACWQEAKHCAVSMNEEIEAENLRENYRRYGVQYVSYEFMLPPRFPLPFVSKTARNGLYFTTIIRDPFKRFLTHYRRREYGKKNGVAEKHSPFFIDFQADQGPYSGDNLNARWLSGALNVPVSRDHVNIAKCRLQLFDLVIADKLFDYAVKKVICPLNNWKGTTGKIPCDDKIPTEEHKSKPDPLNSTAHQVLVGGWIERMRPSFEIYDYARILSWKQLKEEGVQDLPELSDIPSHLETLAKYTNITITDAHFQNIPRVTLENIDQFHPPAEFCDEMKNVWTSNPDEIPNAFGIGTIKNGFRPTHEKGKVDKAGQLKLS